MTENTDMIPVPRELVEYAASQLRGAHDDAGDRLKALLPPKPVPRLVLVDLNSPDVLHTQAMWAAVNPLEAQGKDGGLGALLERIDATPNVLAVIDQQLTAWWAESATGMDELRRRIRIALEGATQ